MSLVEFLFAVAAGITIAIIIGLRKPAKRVFYNWYLKNHPKTKAYFADVMAEASVIPHTERQKFQIARRRRNWNYKATKILEALFMVALLGGLLLIVVDLLPSQSDPATEASDPPSVERSSPADP